jgi:pyruvate/2-oxoacid:ferredoxin oxidoreductase alpha subunit
MDNNTREQFIRIAMARLKKIYPFKPQRIAMVAKMYREFIERKSQNNG